MKIILSFLLIAITLSQLQIGAGETIQIPCISAGHMVYFKTMREFSIISVDKVDSVILTSNNSICSFNKSSSSICTFQNMTREVNITCKSDNNQIINLYIDKPKIMEHHQETNSSLVMIPLLQHQQAIVTIKLNYDIAANLTKFGQNWKQIIYHSDCVLNMVSFQDAIRVAIAKKKSQCTVGMSTSQQWRLDKSIKNIKKITKNLHRGYLHQRNPVIYTLPDVINMTIFMVFQAEQMKDMEKLEIYVSAEDSHNTSDNFTIKNFQKGFFGFQALLFFNKSIIKLTMSSNYNVFYTFSLDHTSESKLRLAEDEYLYLHISKDHQTEFILQLETFEQQSSKPRTVSLREQSNATLNFSYEECLNNDCTNTTRTAVQVQKTQNNQFTPKCTYMQHDSCFIKIKAKSQTNGYFGLLALTYTQNIPLEANKMHTGVLERERIHHYVISKQQLMDSESEVIRVYVSGAKAYFTYDPNCKKLSCTEYWDSTGNIQIPKQNSDLFMFLIGTGHQHYTLFVGTRKIGQIQMPEGLLVKGRLSPSQTSKYYTYKPKDASKSFQINCNALPGTLLLLVNVRSSSFPKKDNAAYQSKDCYVYVSSKEYSQQDTVHITIERLTEQNKSINFNIITITQGTQLALQWGQPYYDYFQPNSSKVIKYFLQSPHNDALFFKIDVLDESFSKPLTVEFVGIDEIQLKTVSDVETFIFQKQQQKHICKEFVNGKCYMVIKISNTGQFGVEASFTTWFTREPLKLPVGEYTNFRTGVLGEQTFFYISILDKTKPINVYIYSTQVEIETIGVIWNQDSSIVADTRFWPFPRFQSLNAQQNQLLTYSFSSFLYFSNQQLQKSQNGSLVLLTIRDRSTERNKSLQAVSTVGFIQIGVSTGFLKMRQNDKFEYLLQKDEVYYFQFPLSGHHLINQKLEIYFHNQALSGDSEISYYFSNSNFSQKNSIFQPTDFLVVKLDQIRKELTLTKHHELSIIFVVRGGTSMGKFIASVLTSTTDYRQLALGVPEQFFIPSHSSVIFEFSDIYNQDFKIKINREEGFPEYRLTSCSPKEDKMSCIKSLSQNKQKKNHQIQNGLISTSSHAHELKIDSKSQHYCKDCTYYIAFYSHNHDLFGSLTVTRPGQSVLLRQSHTLTTQIFDDDVDSYILTSMPTTERMISIAPHMGKISVELMQISPDATQKVVHIVQNSTDGTSINLHIEKNPQVLQFEIKVSSLDKQNAMYSIVLSSTANVIKLAHGVPFKATFKTQSILTLSFEPQGNDIVLVSATKPITIDLTCSSNQSSVISRSKNIKHSKIFNTSLLHLSKTQCALYQIQISNQKPLKLTVLANTEDIVLLPFGMVVPTLLFKQSSKIFEIPIQQKTHLKIVIKLCQTGHAQVGIVTNRQKLHQMDYNNTFQILGDRNMEVFDYTATAGILYIQVLSIIDTIEFTIEVYPILRDSVERSTPKTLLNDSYIDTIQISPGRYNIQFEPFKIIQDKVQYNVSYVLLESQQRSYLRKSLRCAGTFFDINNPNTSVKQTVLQTEKLFDGSLRAPYTSSFEKSYITIMPIASPALPPYAQKVSYQISQLSSGKGPQLIQRMISKMLGAIQALSGIEDENMLNLALILIIVVFNIFLIAMCCWLSARHCRKTIIIERKRLATSEKQGRMMKMQNSLDMLQVPEDQTERDLNNP